MTVSLSLDPQFFNLLAESHQRLVGVPLFDNAATRTDAARWLYEDAPFCLLAHNTDADPCFIYANRAAQRCFEYDWNGITALRSRFSAEQPNREERAQLLESVRTRGFATGYRGVRISRSGRRFWIEGGTVWNLVDSDGVYHGQAATFHQWHDV
ncbi:MEKHLA domain-containing protein [Ralstonia mojiangensis]|uniref:MEKHLA domain-containing protein n=1 Tax=Ralstonia mojiangensis TaxID=2953895 RepID=UPI0021B1F6E5|nr:MEKHLA domain-containing protein [Ralstonia mojiangensis]MCT7327443.1 MEKHLA domain-containing protein [Ralstonia mojiangensis]